MNVYADIEEKSLEGNTCSTPEEKQKVKEAIRKQVSYIRCSGIWDIIPYHVFAPTSTRL